MKALLKTPVIFDGRNLYDPAYMQELNIDYFGIGRGLTGQIYSSQKEKTSRRAA